MSEEQDPKNYKRFLIGLVGIFVLILGVSLILSWWSAMVVLIKGTIGIVLAVAGLLIMYSMNKIP